MFQYKPFLEEADGYYKIVSNSVNSKKKLGNKVIFSLSSMIVEKYLVALLTSQKIAVNGHSIKSLLNMTEKNFQLPEQLANIEELDRKMDLCSFDPVSIGEIDDNEVNELYSSLTVLKSFVHKHIEATSTV